MTCIEFKAAIKDYLEGRLSDNQKSEFSEHLINCQYCRRDIGEDIAGIILNRNTQASKGTTRTVVISFVIFILFLFLAVIFLRYIKLKEYEVGEITPLSRKAKDRLTGQNKKTDSNVGVEIKSPDDMGKNQEERDDKHTEEDFSQYSISELLKRLSECRSKNDYRCISSASLYLAKKSEGSERRKYRLSAIEAFVEQALCSSAMLQIMLLFKENPEIDEINMAHFLNAKCYVKEKNYKDAEKILKMIEKDTPSLSDKIAELRDEIKKGDKDGSEAKSEGIQDRDSP